MSRITQKNNELLRILKEKELILKENKKEVAKCKKTNDKTIKK